MTIRESSFLLVFAPTCRRVVRASMQRTLPAGRGVFADGPVDFKGELRPLFLIGRTGELVSRQTLEVVEHYRSLTISVEPGWQVWTCFARRQLSNQLFRFFQKRLVGFRTIAALFDQILKEFGHLIVEARVRELITNNSLSDMRRKR